MDNPSQPIAAPPSPPVPVGPPQLPPVLAPVSRKTVLKRVLIALVVIIAIVVGVCVYLAQSPQTLSKLAAPALERNAQNTMRQEDVSRLAQAAAQFMSTNTGSLPQTVTADGSSINFCAANCKAAQTSVPLAYYKNTADAVQLKPYASGLRAIDAQTIFVVTGASCNADKTGIGPQTQQDVAFLFALAVGSSNKQRCLSLL